MPSSQSKFSEDKCCILCNNREADEVKYGPIYKLNKIEVHYFCLLLSSSVPQRGEDEDGILGFLPGDIVKAAKEISGMKCSYCNVYGANIKCSYGRCKVTFHYSCGIDNGASHKFSGKFPSYCHRHRSVKKIPKSVLDSIKSVEVDCIVCMENVETDEQSCIWAPCCQKNAFFHKKCLQQMAFSFGYYMLKCPLCNDQKKFIPALQQNGIFIPEQDASWETGPGAFIELYERHNKCDTVICICPRGRRYSTKSESSNWRIILCSSCGSHGIHKKCFENSKVTMMKKKKRIVWECDLCKKVSNEHENDNACSRSTPGLHNNTIEPFGSFNLPETNNNYQLPMEEKKTTKRRRTNTYSYEQKVQCDLSEKELSYCKKCRVVVEKLQ